MFEALLTAYSLKATARAGWLRAGLEAPESVAAHSWGVSLLVLALLPPDLNRERALCYATLHDLAESIVGDITPHDGVSPSNKAHMEALAIAQLGDAGLPQHLATLWNQYEAQADEEARFVRQLDRLDMALQAVCYHEHADTTEFVVSAEAVVTHSSLVPIMRQIRARISPEAS